VPSTPGDCIPRWTLSQRHRYKWYLTGVQEGHVPFWIVILRHIESGTSEVVSVFAFLLSRSPHAIPSVQRDRRARAAPA